jgi:chromosome partitioning protein
MANREGQAMLVIGVLNSKGGVGKSTLTAAFAVRAARDNVVCVVDLDSQCSYSDWYTRRGSPDNPALLMGEDRASDAIEALRLTSPYEIVLLDGPPGSLIVTEDAIKVCDLVVIPLRASGLDLMASRDAVRLCQQSGTAFLCVLNDVNARDAKSLGENARNTLHTYKIPIAKTAVAHRVPYINAMTSGKTGPEKDKAAAEEIDALWLEVKRAAVAASKKKGASNV